VLQCGLIFRAADGPQAAVRRSASVKQAVEAASGLFKVFTETLQIDSRERFEVQNITDRVRRLPALAEVTHGVVYLQSLHTTTALFLNEFQDALLQDVRELLRRLVSETERYLHNDPAHSDCDRGNATSHLRSLLLGNSVTIPVREGKLLLGRFQSVIFAELDGPQTRSIVAHVMGV
jgi:secondary thiamine-phosphate synthase enzyme